MPEKPPLARLSGDYFAPWEDLVQHLPELNKTKTLRSEVDELPELDFSHSTLKSEEEWRRAYCLLSFIGQSYIWGEGQKGLVNKVPPKIAIPWYKVSSHLQMKPVISYATTTLFNYFLRDPQAPRNSDNLSAITTFTGTEDESWFYVVPLLIEMAAAPALEAIGRVYADMARGKKAAVRTCLLTVEQSLQNMQRELKRMPEKCRPIIFYVDIRPFQAGSKGLDAFPEGIIFEGVDPQPCQYHGASAGQSSSIHAFDIFFGIKHSGSEEEFLQAMRSYMPEKHRNFLRLLGEMPSIRDFCMKSGNTDLVVGFNSAIKEFVRFRSDHLIIVTRYIVNQQHHSINPTLDTKGSGGTHFMRFLKNVRNLTSELLIQ